MKKLNQIILLMLLNIPLFAQVSENQLKPFIEKGHHIINKEGPGLNSSNGDFIVVTEDEFGSEASLLMLQNNHGKIKKLFENESIVLARENFGSSGGSSASYEGNTVIIYNSAGSTSSYGYSSITFKKIGNDYLFDKYISRGINYSVENYAERTVITAEETGKLLLSKASEDVILKHDKTKQFNSANADVDSDENRKKFSKFLSKGESLISIAEGDLNLDAQKKDVVLWTMGAQDGSRVLVLLQQTNGSYYVANINSLLFENWDRESNFNMNNQKVVIKDGYFTLEHLVGSGDDFDHRYITFKYNADKKDWLLHRYDVEHFTLASSQPQGQVTHLTAKEFGTIKFDKMDYTPGDYYYDYSNTPFKAKIQGTVIEKIFYGAPNYGKTPEKDEKNLVYLLKPDYPVNALILPYEFNQKREDGDDATVRDIKEIQLIPGNTHLKSLSGKKITLKGKLIYGISSHYYTNVALEVEQVLTQMKP